MSASDVVLSPWSLAAARRLVAGAPVAGDSTDWHPDYPLPDTVDALQLLLAAHEVDGPLRRRPRWWVHQIRRAGTVVGDVGFHGPPVADGPVVVEVGYAVVPSQRGQGVASRALALLLALAWRDGAVQVLAETDEDNLASRAVLRRAGFRRRLGGDFALDRPTGRAINHPTDRPSGLGAVPR